ncbi:hypothetical protein [Sphingomonas sp. Leaf226]|uniref:hypothetical protein n=1 Tax=Sphingomonas sp. Leaf226 TaxID=1735691 RepID=UPI0006F60E6A|nr:hypothetical protein [Sphingomonas sp. Leaf226]KQM99425.1 hypothetical protein ASE77_00045 [Sphingomonas sp. Leaf226]
MKPVTEADVFSLGQRASEIAELSEYLAEALQADPATARAGTAVEGLRTLAAALARALYDFIDSNA